MWLSPIIIYHFYFSAVINLYILYIFGVFFFWSSIENSKQIMSLVKANTVPSFPLRSFLLKWPRVCLDSWASFALLLRTLLKFVVDDDDDITTSAVRLKQICLVGLWTEFDQTLMESNSTSFAANVPLWYCKHRLHVFQTKCSTDTYPPVRLTPPCWPGPRWLSRTAARWLEKKNEVSWTIRPEGRRAWLIRE